MSGEALYLPMRDLIVPMIADALTRVPLFDLHVVGWDFVTIPMTNAIIGGVAIAVRGYDLSGPGRELMQFRPFSSWSPSQREVDTIVDAIITGLREARDAQGRKVNGQ